jgi:hypothetical protein
VALTFDDNFWAPAYAVARSICLTSKRREDVVIHFCHFGLSAEHKAAVLVGMKEGEKKIEEYLRTGGKKVNGWTVSSYFGDRAFYNGNWLLRPRVPRPASTE